MAVSILNDIQSGTSSGSNSATANATLSGGTNRKAVAVVSGAEDVASFTFISVTFGGEAMVSVSDSGISADYNRVAIYELDDIDLPANGSQDCIVATSRVILSLSVHIFVFEGALQGVGEEDEGTEVGTNGQGNTTLTVTDGALQIDVCNNNQQGTAFTFGSGQTDKYNLAVASERHGTSTQIGASSGSEAMTCTGGSGFFAYAAASFASAVEEASNPKGFPFWY